MQWSRELKIARRSVRTAIKAASAMAKAQAKASATSGLAPWSTSTPLSAGGGQLQEADFGSNPGRLTMLMHVPAVPLAPGAPLVVLLHGCGQASITFARDAGWIALSDRLGVPLVL